jgi:hypothetical protein
MSNQERAQRLRQKSMATIARVDRKLAKQPDADIVAEPAAVDWRPEDRTAKWKREGAASDAARAAYKQHLKTIADSQRHRTLQHQIELARASSPVVIGGQHDAEIFAGFEEIAKTFHHVLDRVEALERRLEDNQTKKTQTEHVDRLRYSTRVQ